MERQKAKVEKEKDAYEAPPQQFLIVLKSLFPSS